MRGVRTITLSLLFLLFTAAANSQQGVFSKLFSVPYDSAYISSYVTDYTTRLYGSVKYGMMGYHDKKIPAHLSYLPNNKLLLGIGVNHGFLGLNIGINFPFINQDDEKYGETKYYDFTLRVFAPKFNMTGYLQNYRGYYLRSTPSVISGWQEGDPFYIRPDIRNYNIGLDITYIFNSSRFSYRAAVVQTEWQKKSAGSFLVGGGFLYNVTMADSSMVPGNIAYPEFYDSLDFDRSDIFSIGPVIGYAYTLVVKRHFFLTGSLNGLGNTGFTQFKLVEEKHKIKSGIILGYRIEMLVSAGYNSARWYAGFSYVNMTQSSQAPLPERTVSYNTGMFRVNLVRRFATNKPIRILNPGLK